MNKSSCLKASKFLRLKSLRWHNMFTHTTNNCLIFRNAIQKTIQEGQLRFPDNVASELLVDSNPFPKVDTNMVAIWDSSRLKKKKKVWVEKINRTVDLRDWLNAYKTHSMIKVELHDKKGK
jgi:hypothetical protein